MHWLGTLAEDNRRLETWPKADRRDKRRSKVGMTFRIWFDDPSLDPMTGRTKNLSRKGMYFISLPRNYRRGLRVTIQMINGNQPDDMWQVPDRDDSWRIPGIIVRVAKLPYSLYGIGIEFLHKYKP